jgi:dephospho-CoA kinase
MLRLVLYYYIRGHWAVVLDIPLLFESGLDVLCGGVIMVAVRDPEVQMRRLLDRDRVNGLVRIEAENRVLSQGRVAEKVGRTRERGVGRGAVVWNDGTVEDLRGEVERAVGELVGGCWWVAGREAVAGDDDGKEEDGGHRGAGLKLRFPPHRWWNWWLWASPWVAILVAGVEVWRAWRARRRWKAKERERERDGNRTGDGERERQRERERERERDGEKRTANEWRKID